MGMIPVGYAPSSVVLDTADNALARCQRQGHRHHGLPESLRPRIQPKPPTVRRDRLNTHQDLGIVSIVPIPNRGTLATITTQVFQNNHWDLTENIWSAAGGNPSAKPAAIPARIGEPSKIKHVFVIIRENRTYDQMLGDVTAGNGEATLAVFGSTGDLSRNVTPNAHALVRALPAL